MLVKSSYGLVFLSLLLLSACASTPGSDQEGAAELKAGTVLIFHEQESGAEGSRMIYFVSPDFLRINEWQATEDFVLFDRHTRTIYNVVSKDKTILVIEDRPVTGTSPLSYEMVEQKEKSAATIRSKGGSEAWHYKYSIGDQTCYHTVSMTEYLDDVVQALKEFRTVLAGEHAKTLPSTPPEVLDPCDLAMNIFEPTRYLDKGFPLREWDDKGYQRFLVDVRYDRVPPAEVLKLPEGYERYSIPAPQPDSGS